MLTSSASVKLEHYLKGRTTIGTFSANSQLHKIEHHQAILCAITTYSVALRGSVDVLGIMNNCTWENDNGTRQTAGRRVESGLEGVFLSLRKFRPYCPNTTSFFRKKLSKQTCYYYYYYYWFQRIRISKATPKTYLINNPSLVL